MATAAAPFPYCWKLVGAAALELEVEAALLEPPEEVCAWVCVGAGVAEELEDELTTTLAGSSVPHLSAMLVVQFFWPWALPTLASLHSLKASLQMN